MEESSRNSYRSILKGTSIFGGMQVFLILINLVRGKFVAMFLGPEGMGISSLFNATTNTVVKASSLGLNLAIVKEVAAETESGKAFGGLLRIISRLVSLTALIGCAICMLLARYLSEWTFGTGDYAWQFVALGMMVFLTIVYNGKSSVLQGLHEVKRLSKASIVGALTGLFAGVPLYYFFGTKGIVPAMILFAAVNLIFYEWNVRKATKNIIVGEKNRDFKSVSKKFIGLGILLVAGDLFGTAVTYAINVFLRYYGDVDTVGLYQAANSMTNQYAGAVFAAMSLDYFPRLAAVAADNGRMNETVNRQSEIMARVLGRMSIAVILSAPILIKLLLTESFYPILELMRWMGLGVLLKGLQFPMGYIAFAKNNKKLFVKLEVIMTNVVTLTFSIIGFYFFGLVGLGYAVVAENILALIVYQIVNRCTYGYSFSSAVKREYGFAVMLTTLCLAVSLTNESWIGYVLMALFFMVSVFHGINRIKLLIRK